MKNNSVIRVVTTSILFFSIVGSLIMVPILSNADRITEVTKQEQNNKEISNKEVNSKEVNKKEINNKEMELFIENYLNFRIGKENYNTFKSNYQNEFNKYKNYAKKIYMECIDNEELWSFDRNITEIFDKPTPGEYFKIAVMMMEGALYTNTAEWNKVKEKYLLKSEEFDDYEDAYDAIKDVITVAGGKCSTFNVLTNKKNKIDNSTAYDSEVYESMNKELVQFLCDIGVNDIAGDDLIASVGKINEPKCENKAGILHIILPSISYTADKEKQQKYVNSVVEFLKENTEARGVIVDLRINGGGLMYPVIAALSPLLKDGELFSFLSDEGKTSCSLKDGKISGYNLIQAESFKMPDTIPIIVLSGVGTYSSGESTLMALKSLDNITIYGKPTMGDGCSANNVIKFPDGCEMRLSVSGYITLKGEECVAKPIVPDVDTDFPLQEAIKWFSSIYGENFE